MAGAKDSSEDEGETDGLLDLDLPRVLQEEQELLRRKLDDRGEAASGRPRFALAFSGGGVRAAAFQAGVLWRLAEEGLLKDVDYLAAVSGGAYVAAAFASHALAEAPPGRGEPTDSWYRTVVAKTICRMQAHAGNFVRDPSMAARVGREAGDTGLLPRVLDVPALLLAFAFTVVTVPIELLVVYLVPITEAIYLFFGAALRVTVCEPESLNHWRILSEWSPFSKLMITLEVAVVATFVVWFVGKLPPCQLGQPDRRGRYRCAGYLWAHATHAVLTRMVICLLVLLLFIVIVPGMQLFAYSDAMRLVTNHTNGGFCMQYMSQDNIGIMRAGAEQGCANFHHNKAWYKEAAAALEESQFKYRQAPGMDPGASTYPLAQAVLHNSRSIMSYFFFVLSIVLLITMVLVPFLPGLFLWILWITGPVLAFILAAILLQYRVYGPLTGQPLFFNWLNFDSQRWDNFVRFCFFASLVVVPFYNDLRRLWHWYYVRSLRMSFFAAGSDRSFPDLGTNPYLPLVIFTGTVSDYQRPGKQETISEISFSPLHTGSEVTGYLRTPRYRTLAKCTALTGAGCLDAIGLSMQSHLRFRFWLEMLNLCWGDYILFVRRESRVFSAIAKRCGERFERQVLWILHRTPTLCIWLVFASLYWSGWQLSHRSSKGVCESARGLMSAAAVVVTCIFGLSFFSFTNNLGWLMFSPIIRQMHQATQFHFQGHQPPPLLYVTDGGVKDCTAIVQLVRRRCERILLVLAASDPGDELGVLRAAMEVVIEERLGCFFDPEDSRRDVRILLHEFQQNPEQKHLRLGVRFGWSGDAAREEAAVGMLLVVKNRLPPSLERCPVRPLLTEEELARSAEDKAGLEAELERDWKGLVGSDLGGLGCCDCCHRNNCNCGTKFPHLTGANYVWLTPRLFSGLCRLGRELSGPALREISAALPPGR